MRLTQLVANLQPELELLRIIGGRRSQTRIGFDLEVLSQRLTIDRELHLIHPRRHFWTTRLTGPENHSRETYRIRVSRVPNKTIEPHFSRYWRRSATTKRATLTRRWTSRRRRRGAFTRLSHLRSELSNRLPCRIEELEIDIGGRFRFQRVVNDNTVRRVPSQRRCWSNLKTTAARHAITLFRREQLRLTRSTKTTRIH